MRWRMLLPEMLSRLVQVLTEERRAGFDRTAAHYVELAGRHRASLSN